MDEYRPSEKTSVISSVTWNNLLSTTERYVQRKRNSSKQVSEQANKQARRYQKASENQTCMRTAKRHSLLRLLTVRDHTEVLAHVRVVLREHIACDRVSVGQWCSKSLLTIRQAAA